MKSNIELDEIHVIATRTNVTARYSTTRKQDLNDYIISS